MKKITMFAAMISMTVLAALCGCKKAEEKMTQPALNTESASADRETTGKKTDTGLTIDKEDKREETADNKDTTDTTAEEAAVDEYHEKLLTQVTEDIIRCKEEKDLNSAYLAVYNACDKYPDDEVFSDLKQEIAEQFPSLVDEHMIVNKKSCRIENEWLTGVNGENLNADFKINLGGGSLSLTLEKKYSMVNLKAMLGELSPTKAKVDIDIYADGELLYSIEDFSTLDGTEDIWLNVEGKDTFIIDSADHDHEWVGEASFSKPDSNCHFSLSLYEEKDLEWVL